MTADSMYAIDTFSTASAGLDDSIEYCKPAAHNPPRLLLVDDEPNILNSLRRALNSMPPALFGGKPIVETFEDPRLALLRASECAFDLVLSDYRMPHLNGVAFLSEFKKIQPAACRLILSGFADLNALVAAINDVQIFRFIAKPWDDYDLGASIAQALEHRRLQQENVRLADRIRIQDSIVSRQELELQRLEQNYPGLTQVKRCADGSIDLDLGEDI